MNSSDKKNRVCAIIPFYNEEKFLFNVINKTLKFVDVVIAVNDGSTDNSELLIKNLPNVSVLSLNENIGKGSALQLGFIESIKNKFDIVITLDGDNQHNPKFIPAFVNTINNFDIVIGNRLSNIKDMPFMRILSNKITSFLLSLKTEQKIFDSQCGYRAYKIEVLKNVKTKLSGYEAESEILVLASKLGYKIGFVEISTIYQNEKSKMRPFEAIAGFIKVLIK